jgi:DNA mismatch repair protein MutL
MLNKSSVNFNASVFKSRLISKGIKNENKKIKKVNFDKILTKEQFQSFKLIGQFDKKFIIAYNSVNNDIVIFDQHAIHERILYEFYSDLLKNELFLITNDERSLADKNLSKLNLFNKIFDKFYLKEPLIIKFEELVNIESINLDLNRMNSIFNFDFLGFYDKRFIKLLTVPIIFDKILDLKNYSIMFCELLNNLSIIFDEDYSIKNKSIIMDIFLRVIKTRACKDAVKFNEELDSEFQIDLIENLKNCLDPFLCAHGRHNFFILYKS